MADKLPPAHHYLRTPDAARLLGLSGRTLEKHRTHGTGPRYRKLGRAVRYMQADLDHWLMACSRTSTAEQQAVKWLAKKSPSKT